MKVVHFSTSVSASSANTRLHFALQKAGIESKIFVSEFNDSIDNVFSVKLPVIEKIEQKIIRYICQKEILKYDLPQSLPFSVGRQGYDVSKLSAIMEADIIHLHWICNFLSLKSIERLTALNKPVVWTCHDSWPFTGGCHVRYGCERYRQGCGRCPILNSEKDNDITAKIIKSKMERFKDNRIAFIAPSNWMSYHINASALFKNNICKVIPNTIDFDIFKEMERQIIEAKLDYKKDENKIHILFGAGSINIPYKGFHYLLEMLEHLYVTKRDLADRIVLHIIGGSDSDQKIIHKYEHVFWGYIEEQEKMACVYNVADVYVYPSIDDNLPNMVMESLACATPVVSFATGGIPDMIDHKKNGYIAEYKDSGDLLKGLLWIIDHNEDNVLGKNGKTKVNNRFNESRIAEMHIDFYKSLLN